MPFLMFCISFNENNIPVTNNKNKRLRCKILFVIEFSKSLSVKATPIKTIELIKRSYFLVLKNWIASIGYEKTTCNNIAIARTDKTNLYQCRDICNGEVDKCLLVVV